MRLTLITLIASTALLQACGANCQEACNRAFNESECNLRIPGETQDDLFDDCVAECEWALRTPGELEGYDPDEPSTSGESMVLDNEKQAAVWMDCVMETSCERLDQGHCAGAGI